MRQLEGLETPRLVLIDARHPAYLRKRLRGWSPWAVKRRAEARAARRKAEGACATAERYIEQHVPIPAELRSSYILGTYQLAAHRYVPPPYAGAVEVIRSEEWTLRSPSDHWEESIVRRIRRMTVEGSHLSLVRSKEGVSRIGSCLSDVLAEVNVTRQGHG
jgi:thioesterase domain-containing protein